MNECLTDEVLQNQSPFTFANLRVIVVDEDIDPLNFDQETKLNKKNIKIKEHQEFYHGCPCIENKDNVVKFDDNVQKCTYDVKCDGEAQKIKDNNNELKKRQESGDSCPTPKRRTHIKENVGSSNLTYDHLLATKSLINNADFFNNNFDAMIFNGNHNVKIRWRHYYEIVSTNFIKIGFWYQMLYEKEIGECFSEENEVCCEIYGERMKIDEKRRAFEKLEYKLIIDECDEQGNKKPNKKYSLNKGTRLNNQLIL